VLKTRAELSAGGITRGVLAGPKFDRVVHGIHVPTHVAESLEPDSLERLRLRCAALARVVPDGVFSHRTAAQLLGLPLFGTHDTVEITVAPPKNPPRHKGVKGYERELAPADVEMWRGLPVTSAARTFLDVAEQVPMRELVALGDAELRRGLTTPDELAAAINRCAGRRGLAVARLALPRLDGSAASPPESLLRMRFEEEGLPRPECNFNIYDALGEFMGCADFALEDAKILVEYDGAHHLTVEQQRSDSLRDRLYIGLGWLPLRATFRDTKPWAHDLFDLIRELARERT
jgi:very-short-patch-repair endonuclease